MRSRPRVSVIMPAFNTEHYVVGAIRSAQAQTIRDIEIIVVDDGSTDGTFAAALNAADGDSRVSVWTRANTGPSGARNLAMERATGDFFAFLDSDDEWMPEFLDHQLTALARHPSASVATGNAINRGGVFDGTPYRGIQPQEHELSLVEMIGHEDSVCILSVFRRAVYDTAGPMEESLRGNEDYEFWLRAAQHGFGFLQTFEPLAYYRRRPDSASADNRKMAAGILRVFAMARATCRQTDELRAIDRQIARFERELLGIDARAALKNHDFAGAAESYRRLRERSGDARAAAMAFAVEHAPRLVLWAAHARHALRRATLARAQGD